MSRRTAGFDLHTSSILIESPAAECSPSEDCEGVDEPVEPLVSPSGYAMHDCNIGVIADRLPLREHVSDDIPDDWEPVPIRRSVKKMSFFRRLFCCGSTSL